MTERTIYYKNVTIGGSRYTVVTPGRMSNEEFSDRVGETRRIFGYSMYLRWLSARMLLGDTYDLLRKRGLFRHRVKKMANQLNAEFDAFERLHQMDFDQDWIEVAAGSISMQIRDKVNDLRGAVGGALMRKGVKDYVFYSYPMTVLVLAKEGEEFHDALMRKIIQRFGLDFREVFRQLRGDKVTSCIRSLISAIEDAMGDRLPRGLDDEGMDLQLQSLARLFYDDKTFARAFQEAGDECEERDFNTDAVAEKLATKYKVTRQ